jgi:hypothetical protein
MGDANSFDQHAVLLFQLVATIRSHTSSCEVQQQVYPSHKRECTCSVCYVHRSMHTAVSSMCVDSVSQILVCCGSCTRTVCRL